MRSLQISSVRFWLLSLVIAAVAFLLRKPLVLDNVPASAHEPAGAVLVGFIVVSILSSLAMGIGIAILVFGGTMVARLPEPLRPDGRVVQLALVWLIAPWWVHEALHITNGEQALGRLLAIEYGFHVTSYAAAIAAAVAAARIVVELSGTSRSSITG